MRRPPIEFDALAAARGRHLNEATKRARGAGATQTLSHGTAASILRLQRSAGNRAVASIFGRARRRSLARRSVDLVNPPAGAPKHVYLGALVIVFVNGVSREAFSAPDPPGDPTWILDWDVPKDARTVRIEEWINGGTEAWLAPGADKSPMFGGRVVGSFNVEADGTLTATQAAAYPGDQRVSGAVTSFDGGISSERPDSLTITARAALDAGTQRQATTGKTTGTTTSSSTQGSVTQTGSTSSGTETTSEDTNIIGRGVRQIPDVGPVILGKPDVKKTSETSGSSTTVTGSTTASTSGQSQDTTSQTTSGAGETTTNVVRQTIVVRVHSPYRDAPGSFVEITNFDPGSAKIKPQHLDALLPFLEGGDEPTLLERLTHGHAKIQLYGYASKPGSWDVNQKVARDRVAAVKRYLTTDKLGIPAAAFLEPVIYGKGRTTTPPGPGGKDVEDDAWRKVKVKIIDTR